MFRLGNALAVFAVICSELTAVSRKPERGFKASDGGAFANTPNASETKSPSLHLYQSVSS
jgi:hypothetical protein